MSRLRDYLDAVEAALRAPALGLRDVRLQLDAVDLEDLATQSFQTPAARVVLMRAASVRNPDRSLDLDCAIVVAILARAEGPQPADMAAMERALAVLILAGSNRWGLTRILAPRELALRPAVEAAQTKGVSVVLVTWQQRLVRITEGQPLARGHVADGVHGPDGLGIEPVGPIP